MRLCRQSISYAAYFQGVLGGAADFGCLLLSLEAGVVEASDAGVPDVADDMLCARVMQEACRC